MTARLHRHILALRALAIAIVLGLSASSASAAPSGQKGKEPTTESRRASGSTRAASAALVLDLNRATEDELTQLPGVGPKKARAIVALRTRLKGFKRVEDLMRVKGIGRKTFRKLKPMVRVR